MFDTKNVLIDKLKKIGKKIFSKNSNESLKNNSEIYYNIFLLFSFHFTVLSPSVYVVNPKTLNIV